jgi:hypothetical protein
MILDLISYTAMWNTAKYQGLFSGMYKLQSMYVTLKPKVASYSYTCNPGIRLFFFKYKNLTKLFNRFYNFRITFF